MGVIKFIFETLESIVSGILEASFDIIKALLTKERKTEYTAEFGQLNDQLQRKGGGFRIGYKWGNDLLDSNNHLICLGGSGSKKSTCVCFNTLLQSNDSSYVVFDCSRELYNGTAAYKYSNGNDYNVYKFDLDNYMESIGFNWIQKCDSESDVSRFSQVLIKNSIEDAPYDYWAQSSENLISFFTYVLSLYAEPEYVNMANVLNMIQVFSFDPKRIDRWIIGTGNERLINRYKSIVSTPEKTLQSSIATATNTLAIYNNPNIAAITSKDTLSFDEFRTRKTILYINGSPSMIQYAKGICACFFESFFAHILQNLPGKNDLNITFLIDECATMKLLTLPKILELGRKYRISVATLWQDYGQIEHIYGNNQASNILANSKLKAFMPSGQPLATCKMLEALLGRYSFRDDKDILRTRELLNAQEIFQLKKILLLNGNNKPLLIEPHPYFESAKLRRLAELPIHQITNPVPLQVPPFLNF